jgi:hypothetical protein
MKECALSWEAERLLRHGFSPQAARRVNQASRLVARLCARPCG